MAIQPFAFDPPTGWNDPAVFPTYEASEAKVRSDMQKLHDQTRDYINDMVDAMSDSLLTIEIPSFSVLPQTVTNSRITSDHVVVSATPGTPEAVVGEWTVTTANGSLTITGTISGSTTLRLVLGASVA